MTANHPGRVERAPESLADRASIINLLAAYAHFANVGDIDGWADCFTADATYRISAPGAPGEPIPKAKFVAAETPQFAAYRRMLAEPMTGERKIYCIVNPFIRSLDAGMARVVAELVQLRTGAATPPRIQLTGTYQGELIRTEEIWRIRRWEVQTTRQPESVSEVPALWWLNVAANADGDWRTPS
jgi:hypothetical protein